MKKQKINLFMSALSLFFLVGCGQGAETEKKSKPEKTGVTTFYIVRHGKTMLNVMDRVQGWSDAVLTPAGEKVVTNTGKGLKNVKFNSAYSSDSGRAVQTAQLILKENRKSEQVKLKTDSRFREFNFGSYEGDLNHNMWSDIAKDQGKTLNEWLKAGVSPQELANSVAKLDQKRTKKGKNWPAENYAAITERLKKGMDSIAKKGSKEGEHNVLLVSHGLSIGALINSISPGFKLPDKGIKNASVTKIEYKNGKYTVRDINDLSYLKQGEKEK